MAYDGGQWTITGTATNITSALGLTGGDMKSGGRHCNQVIIRNKTGATAPLYLGKSAAVTAVPANATAEIAAGQDHTIGNATGRSLLNTDEIFLIGTANAANIAFIELVV